MPFLAVTSPTASLPDVLPTPTELLETRCVLIALVKELAYLGEKDGVSEVESAVFVIE